MIGKETGNIWGGHTRPPHVVEWYFNRNSVYIEIDIKRNSE